MSEPFDLDPQLKRDTLPVCDLMLSSLRLMNDARFPWMILVPRRAGVNELLDLSFDDRHRLLDETAQVAEAIRVVLKPKKLNIAAIGNVVAQLHVHIVARFIDDSAWPRPVWGIGNPVPYSDDAAAALIDALTHSLGSTC